MPHRRTEPFRNPLKTLRGLAILLIAAAAVSPERAHADATSLASAKYLMAFHSCDTTTGTSYCSGNPSHHYTQLAGSDDSISWKAISGWTPWQGSVPDIIRRGNTLYVYNASSTIHKIDVASGAQTSASISIRTAAGANVSFVDPSPILDSSGKIVLFYLNSTGMTGDPASCSSFANCVKTFSSATEITGSDGAQFIQDDGDRVKITLTGIAPALAASDPDIFQGPSGYVLLVSQGSNVLAFQSATLQGSYTAIPGLTDATLIAGAGGVPAGHYDESSGEYWLFVHKSASPTAPTVIKRAKTSSLGSALNAAHFSDALTGSGLALGSSISVESPGFMKNTPGTELPPAISALAVSGTSAEGTVVSAVCDKNATIYWIVVPQGSAAPTAAQVETGSNYGTTRVIQKGSLLTSAASAFSQTVGGLAAGTAYTLHLIAKDASGQRSAVANVSFTTVDAIDTTPDPFAFTPQNGVARNSEATSESVAITGINTAVPVSVSNGSYSLDNGSFTGTAGTLLNGQSVRVRVTASGNFSMSSTAVLTVGSGSGNFTVTTTDGNSPAAFAFTAVRNAPRSSVVESNAVTLTGLSGQRTITVSGGELSINGNAYSGNASTVGEGSTIKARLTSSAQPGRKKSATVSIGSTSAKFEVSTRGGLAPGIPQLLLDENRSTSQDGSAQAPDKRR